jgi:RNA polymerase sigma factor (sigma-70 family)
VTQAAPTRLLPDATIARRAAGGNQRAFEAIFGRYHQDLYRYCAAILGNAEDAHDAVQNTMLKVLRALPGEKRELKLKPWLYRIAHNEAIDLVRARRSAEPIDAEALAGPAGPAEEAETRARLQQLIADIAELPTRQRGALVMREMNGLSYEQIGEALETSPAVARQTIYEARLSLRQMSEGREMPCAEVMRAISDGDGRVLRRRDIRAHLHRCEDCKVFRAEIAGRRQEFAALAPLPLAASAGILQGLLGGGTAGGSSAAGGAAGAAAGKVLVGSTAIKSAAAVLAVSAIGVVAADRSGVIDLGVGNRHGVPAKVAPEPGVGRAPTDATVPQARSVAAGIRAAARRRHQIRRAIGQHSEAVSAKRAAGLTHTPGTAAAPTPHSQGKHLGQSKGPSHGASTAKPEHPAKGKKNQGAAAAGQAKSHGHSQQPAAEKNKTKPAVKPHPAHPQHPAHPDKPPPAAPEAEPAVTPEAGNGAHGKPPAE